MIYCLGKNLIKIQYFNNRNRINFFGLLEQKLICLICFNIFKNIFKNFLQTSVEVYFSTAKFIYTNTIGYQNSLIRITTQFLTPLMLCVLILYMSGGMYCLNVPDFFEKLFMAILFTLKVFARNLLRGNRRRNIFRISF